jgi:hypothetical protein
MLMETQYGLRIGRLTRIFQCVFIGKALRVTP